MSQSKKYKLSKLIDLKRFMKIPLDGFLDTDADGNYLLNVGYIRVSTDKQADEGYGLTVQTNAIVNYCNQQGITNLLLFCFYLSASF